MSEPLTFRVMTIALAPMALVTGGIALYSLNNDVDIVHDAPSDLADVREAFLSDQLAVYLLENDIDPAAALEQAMQSAADDAVIRAFTGALEVINSYDEDTLAMLASLENIRDLIDTNNLAAPVVTAAAYPEVTYDPADEGYYYEYGEYLAGECTACHSISYEFTGIPIIFGQDVSYFVGRMKDYADGTIDNSAMQSVAAAQDEEMLLSLAVYFAKQEPAE